MKKNSIMMALIFAITTFTSCKKDPSSSPDPTPQVFTTTTFAGSDQGFIDGTGTAAKFNVPVGIVKDAAGNFFVADRDNHRIRKITPTGVVSTFAGNGTSGFVDGAGTSARFNQPYALAIDASGNLYVGDRINHSIRKISPSGMVTTLAGNGTSGSADGTGNAARFDEPLGVAVDAGGNVFVADYINNRIRKITPGGAVSTFAGNQPGYTDGAATAAEFFHPFGITIDVSGNLYVSEFGNHTIRKITASGNVSTIAGATQGYLNATGTAAKFNQPAGLVTDANNNLYVCDGLNNVIRKITPSGEVTTVAGDYNLSGATDGIGSAATFNFPIAICSDLANTSLFIADFYNHRIRKIKIQ